MGTNSTPPQMNREQINYETRKLFARVNFLKNSKELLQFEFTNIMFNQFNIICL